MTGIHLEEIKDGGVCTPKGFLGASATAGIKKSGKPDIAIIRSEVPAQVAAAFTQNSFAAAPVIYCKQVIRGKGTISALVSNSGNANACTGRKGFTDAKNMAAIAAQALGLPDDEVLVFSTGRIGVPLPMDKIESGIKDAASHLSNDADWRVAEGIMTTDTVPKSFAVSIDIDGHKIHIGGTSKGAGMIAPQMKMVKEKQATMFSFITTDAVLDEGVLEAVMEQSLNRSFNRITVDGDTSTNDSFVALANGLAKNPSIRTGTVEMAQFQQAFDIVAGRLAKWLIEDGEGVTKFIELRVTGAHTDADAETCARAIGNSLLCKTAWFGADPNWGRVLDAAGYSGIEIQPDCVSLYYENQPVVKNGMDVGTSEEELAKLMQNSEFHIDLDIGIGEGEFTLWTCDLSYEYVKINADYHT